MSRAARRVPGRLTAAFSAVAGVSHLPILGVLMGLSLLERATYVVYTVLISAGVLFGCLHRMSATRGRIDRRQEPVGVFLLLFILAGLVSCVYAGYTSRQYYAIEMWQQYLMSVSIVLLYFAYRYLVRFGDIRRFITLGFDLAATVAIASIVAHLLGIATGEGQAGRQFGILGDTVAWLLSVFCVVYFERRNWLAFIAAALLLVITGSRAPAIFAVAGMVLATLFRRSESIKGVLRRLSAVAILLVGVYVAPLLAPDLATRLRETDILYNDRVETARFGLLLFKESPWLGLGFNAQPHFSTERFGADSGRFMILSSSSSTPVQILADSGLLGIIPFALAMLALLAACYGVARAPINAALSKPDQQFVRTVRALACWLIPFILLNHAVAYHNPLSMVGVLFFSAAGAVVGHNSTMRRANQVMKEKRRDAASRDPVAGVQSPGGHRI